MLFITGSESFIGKKLIQKCKENNIKYFGIDSKSKKSKNSKKIDIRKTQLAQKNPIDMTSCPKYSMPGMFCKPERPLLPLRPLSFWNKYSDRAKVNAWVKIER